MPTAGGRDRSMIRAAPGHGRRVFSDLGGRRAPPSSSCPRAANKAVYGKRIAGGPMFLRHGAHPRAGGEGAWRGWGRESSFPVPGVLA